MKALFILFSKYFLKSGGPITVFLIPILVMGAYTFFGWDYYIFSFPLYVALAITPLSLLMIPQIIIDLKQSQLLKRIGATNIKPIIFLITLFLCVFIITIIAVLFIFLSYYLIGISFDNSLNANGIIFKEEYLLSSGVNYGNFIYSIFIAILLNFLVGTIIGIYIQKSMTASIIGFSIFMLSLFLGGLLAPFYFVRNQELFKIIAYFDFLVSPFFGMIETWGIDGTQDWLEEGDNILLPLPNTLLVNRGNIFNFNETFHMLSYHSILPIDLLDIPTKIYNIVFPLFFIPIFTTIISLNFNWGLR